MGSCDWPGNNILMQKYHDEEWGVPINDDAKLFEFMVLDAFQAGLSWSIILNKRENFRKAFSNFNPTKIAKYDSNKIEELLQNVGIIRNKQKITATVINANKFLEIRKEFGSFDKYIWSFVNYKPIVNQWKTMTEIPVKSEQSDEMSRELKSRGFKFVGTTICYAFMQAAGLVNDHVISCSRYRDLKKLI